MSGRTTSRGSWPSAFRWLWWRGGSSAASPRHHASGGGGRDRGRLMTDGKPRWPLPVARRGLPSEHPGDPLLFALIVWTARTPRLTEKQHARYNRRQPLARAGRVEERGIRRLEAAQYAV